MTTLERIVKRDRAVVALCLAFLVGLAWLYLLNGGGMSSIGPRMGGMDGMSGATPEGFVVTYTMWTVMMAAMMLPSAAPMILLYGGIAHRSNAGSAMAGTGVFVSGYLAVWTAFALAAAGLQIVLQRESMLSADLRTTSAVLGGGVLVAAGIYQLTPLKHACLARCQSPVGFLTQHWRPGTFGAIRMGVVHGLYCLGCCWVLMALLFVGGVMNLLVVALIALAVLAEKVVPVGGWLARAGGVALVVGGSVVVLRVLF